MRIPEPILNEDFYMVKRIGGDVALPAPRTRFEELLYIYAGGTIERPTPKTVDERFLDYITGGESELPTPKTRLQSYMYNVANPANKIPVVPPKTRFECYWYIISKINNVISDELPVEFTSIDGFLLDYTIWGNSEQDGVPTPEEHIEVQSVGDKSVNLFDINDSKYFVYPECYVQDDKFIITSIGGGVTSRIYWSKVYPAGTYFITAKSAGGVNDVRFYSPIQYSGGSYNSYYQGWYRVVGNGIAVTFNQNFTVGFIANGRPADSGYVYDIQIQEGSTGTNFEPYGKYKIPVTVSGENDEESTTNIYLDETLRKIGDYADYVDFENQQLIKNVDVVNFTGEEEWRAQGNAYFTYIPPTPPEKPPTLCSAFSLSTSGSTAVGEYRLDGLDSWNGNVLFNYDNGAGGVDNFKSYLADQYANGTPVKFYYPCVAAITEVIELPKIPTFAGTNVIDVDTTVKPSKIEFRTRTE